MAENAIAAAVRPVEPSVITALGSDISGEADGLRAVWTCCAQPFVSLFVSCFVSCWAAGRMWGKEGALGDSEGQLRRPPWCAARVGLPRHASFGVAEAADMNKQQVNRWLHCAVVCI
jgi:hypothetical protein